MAQTVDGKIAKSINDNSLNWTSLEDKKHFGEVTKQIGTVIMGSKTYEAMGQKALKNRKLIIMTSNPKKYETKEGVEFFTGTPEELVKNLESAGVDHVVLAGGARLNNSFMKDKLVDELLITVEPLIWGNGISIFEGEQIDAKLELIEIAKLNQDTLLLHYSVIK